MDQYILFRSRKIRTHTLGEGVSMHHGRGIDVTDIGTYTPGDDTRDISWRHSARTTNLSKKIRSETDVFPILIINTLTPNDGFFTEEFPKSSFESGEDIVVLIERSAKKYHFPIVPHFTGKDIRNTLIFLIGKSVSIEQYLPYLHLAPHNDIVVLGISHPEEISPKSSRVFSGFSLKKKSYKKAFHQAIGNLKTELEAHQIGFISLLSTDQFHISLNQFFKYQNTHGFSRTPS